MNDSVFANMYIEKILNEVLDLTKSKLLLQTQLSWYEKQIQEMTDFQNKLQQANNELTAKLKSQEKKETKTDETETPEENF